MRKLIALPLLLLLFIPIPSAGERGAYNVWSGLAWCQDYSTCVHEVGHALDKRAGWISQSPEFAEALQMYILTGARNDDRVIILLAMTYQQEQDKRELYAAIFEMAEGKRENTPIGLRDFYNWEKSEEYLRTINGKGIYLWRN